MKELEKEHQKGPVLELIRNLLEIQDRMSLSSVMQIVFPNSFTVPDHSLIELYINMNIIIQKIKINLLGIFNLKNAATNVYLLQMNASSLISDPVHDSDVQI